MILPAYKSPDGRVTLYHGDALMVLEQLHGFDVIIADPPYGETNLRWDRWPRGWPMAVLKLAPSMWCFGTLRMFMDHALDFSEWQLAQDLIWEKQNGTNSAVDRFRRVHEQIAHFYRGPWNEIYRNPLFTQDATKKQVRRKARPLQWGEIGAASFVSHDGGPRRMRSVLHERNCHGRAIHPTQKPLGVLAALLEYSCPPSGTVLDLFGGSFNAGVAALRLGLSYVGVEADDEHFAAGRQNIEAEIAAKRLDFSSKSATEVA